MSKLRIEAAGLSHVGMKRKQNQDSYALVTEHDLFIVADGMGGHKGGETASAIAVSTISDYFKTMSLTSDLSPEEKLFHAINNANSAIQNKGFSEPELQGMGTTTVTLYFMDGQVFIGHVGDSRCYLVRNKSIWQMTRDHSLVQEKLRAGLITREQIKTDKMRNVITRSVGFEPTLDVDVYQVGAEPGDVFILCSDGLSGLVDDDDIAKITTSEIFENKDLYAAPQKLIELANKNGGDDNVTAVVIRIY